MPYGPQCGLFNISAGDEEYSELMPGADVFARRKNLVWAETEKASSIIRAGDDASSQLLSAIHSTAAESNPRKEHTSF